MKGTTLPTADGGDETEGREVIAGVIADERVQRVEKG